MRRLTFFVLLWLMLPMPQFAQTSNIIARNFRANGKVIELTLPPNFEGARFNFGFLKDGQSYGMDFFGRAGKHYYDLRGHLKWNGKIEALATNLPKEFSTKLVSSSLSKEIDIFSTPDRFTPTTINLVWLKTFFGFRWSVILFFLAILISVGFWFLKKSKIGIALSVGIITAFVIMDLRNVADRVRIIQGVESTYPYVFLLENVQKFVPKAREIIGDQLWRIKGVDDGFQELYLKSQLADLLTVKGNKKSGKERFIITNQPDEKGEIVLTQGNFYLIRRPTKK